MAMSGPVGILKDKLLLIITFHSENVPDGTVWNSRGVPSVSKPMIRLAIPNGRTPPD